MSVRSTRPEGTGGALLLLLLLAATSGGCESKVAPAGIFELRPGMGHDEAAELIGSACPPVHDRGVRVLEWRQADQSILEITIHEGAFSSARVLAPRRLPRPSRADAILRGGAAWNDLTELEIRARLGDEAQTVDDTSDRECSWAFRDGELHAIFLRGRLHEASWQEEGSKKNLLVAAPDRVSELLSMIRSPRPSERFRGARALRGIDELRVREALLALLTIETESSVRAQAALALADLGEERASDLLLPDIEGPIVADAFLDAIGRIGNLDAAEALLDLQVEAGSYHTKGRAVRARNQILRRHGLDPSFGR